MKGAELVIKILKLEGTDFISCFPYSTLINPAHDAGIRPILARTERGAVNIADGYSRTSNGTKIGVCVMQESMGIENGFSGIAQAYSDSVPILVLPGQYDRHRSNVNPIYSHNTHVFKTVTKWADCINFAERIPEMMRRAFTFMRTGRAGPVLLELPHDVASEEVNDTKLYYTPVHGWKTSADPRDVKTVAKAILGAKNPILHVGHGIFYAQAWDELLEFAELTQIPVMTTIAGKSAFPEDHPLSLGYGGYTGTKAASHFLAKADLVFSIGSSLTAWWLMAAIPRGKVIIQSSIDEYDVNKDYPADYVIMGDAKLVLGQLVNEFKRTVVARQNEKLVQEIRSVKDEWLKEWMPRLTSNEVPINPYRVVWDFMQATDRKNTIVTHDAGYTRDELAPFYEATVPRGYIGWGNRTTLGYSLGGAIGAKLAEPKKLVANFMGDAAMGMTATEFETATREKIPILTIVLNNSVMGGYSRRTPSTYKLSGDYAKMAEAMGGYSERVEEPDEIVSAIKRARKAIDSGRPALLNVVTKEELAVSH